MTVIKTLNGRIVGVEDGRTPGERPPSKIPTAYRTCVRCKGIYAEADNTWHEIILDGKQVRVCRGCHRKLTTLVEG